MTPIEVDEVLDRLCGEFEYEMSDDEEAIWREAIKAFDRDQCLRAVDRCMDTLGDMPTIASFRLEAIKQGQRAQPKERCGCLDGWLLPTAENYVTACRSCATGEIRAACVEAYRSYRADLRRKHRTPDLLKERPASPEAAHGWANQARDWLENGMPEPEPVPAGYDHDEEF